MNKRTEQTRWTPKRLLSLLMALIMTLSLLPTAAFAADSGTAGSSANPVSIGCMSVVGEYKVLDDTLGVSGVTDDNITLYPKLEYTRTGERNDYSYDASITFMVGFRAKSNSTTEVTGTYSVKVEQLDAAGKTVPNLWSTIYSSVTINNSTDYGDSRSVSFSARALEAGDTIHLKYTFYKGDGTTDPSLGSIYVDVTDFTFNVYTVTYDANGGTLSAGAAFVNANNGKTGETYTIPESATATKNGFTFTGWKTTLREAERVYQPGKTIENINTNITLTAEYEQNYKITFNPGKTGVVGLPYDLTDMSAGKSYTPDVPTLNGYTFAGWKVTKNGGTLPATVTKGTDGKWVVDGIDSDITLTAQWTKDGTTPAGSHSVKFVRRNATDGSALNWPDNQIGAAGNTVTIPYLIPQAEGYTFLGWSTTEGATTPNSDYAYGANVTIGDTDINLYAVWQEKTVKVTYKSNVDGVKFERGNNDTVKVGTPWEFYLYVQPGYDPDSISVTANGQPLGEIKQRLFYSDASTFGGAGTTKLTFGFNAMEDTTIYYSAPKKLTYSVTLPISDKVDVSFTTPASDAKSTTVEYGSEVTFKVTARTGYTVKGVYANGVKLTATNDTYTISNITADQTVTVDVEAIQFHKVTYIVRDTTYLVQDVQHGKTSTVEDPVVEGYTFMGWYTKQNGEGEQFTNTTAITGDITVYAQLQAVTHRINYDLNAPAVATVTPGTIDATTKTYGKAVTLSAVKPTCDGYDFLGWAKGENKGLVVYAAGATVSEELTADMTLYAVWAKKTYTITLQGGSGYTVSSNQALVVEHGSNFNFTVTVDGAYAANEPVVTANDTTLTKVSGETNAKHEAATYTYTISNVTADQVVTVKVTENERATVTFQYRVVDANGNEVNVDGLSGETFMTQAVQLGDPAAQPQQPNIEGCKFVRWCGAGHPTATTHEAYDFTNPVAGALTIYAEITPILPVITVTNALSGTGWKTEKWQYGTETMTNADTTNKSFTIAYGDNVTFDLVIAEGYDYSKLSVTANGLALGYQSATTDETTGVTTLHYYLGSVKADTRIAITGIERKTITITYNANARDDVSGLPSPQVVKYYLAGGQNDTVTTQEPKRTGYAFLGWNIDSEAETAMEGYDATAVKAGNATAKFITDTTLYAIWKADALTAELIITDEFTSAGSTTSVGNKLEYAYEGDSITLVGKLSADAQGTMTFYKKAKTATDWTFLGTTSINGGNYGVLGTTVENYKWGNADDAATKSNYRWDYKVEFKPTTDEGYSPCEASDDLRVYSKAISWEVDKKTDTTTYNWTNAKNTLTIYTDEARTAATDKMTANSTYWLQIPTVVELDGGRVLKNQSKNLSVGTHYEITWEYEDSANHWTTYTTTSDTDWVKVTPEYSGYSFHAKVTPTQSSIYTKAATYDENGTVVKDVYWDYLITKATAKTEKQATATTLTITDAETESASVKINGTTPFTAISDHLAQFEGQTVTLTAKVTKDGTTPKEGVETGKVEFYRLDGSEWKLIDTVNVETQGTNTGVASTTYTMGAYDSTSAGASATTNKETFKAVYVANETYATSTTDGNADVYIKSAKLMTPVIESEQEGTNGAKATTYNEDLTGLLAGVQHTFKLRTTGAEAGNDNWSVVALDGRSVESDYYDVKWLKTTGSNEQEVDVTGTNQIKVDENKDGDRYRVKLTGKGVFANSEATSKDAVIGTKQDVTVTVEAIDAIKSTTETDVYQLNEITLTATVAAAKGADATMKPTGTVTFYYSVDGNNWTKIGEAKDLAEVTGVMTASIQTDQLPVKAGDNTKQDVKITAVYSGDATFNASGNYDATNNTASAGTTVNGVTDDTVTVYSSVVFNCEDENKKQTTDNDKGIHISVSDGAFKANERATLKLSDIYTLDRELTGDLLNTIAKLNPTTDYTVQWQKLNGATAITGSDYSAAKNWMDIDGATGTTLVLNSVEQNTAYRAVITVNDQPITKGSYKEVDQTIKGRQVYYSNVLMPTDTSMTVSVALNTSKIGAENTEGITEGETVTANVFLSGVVGVVPNANVTVKVTNDSAKGNDTAYEKTFTSKNTVNGWNAFDWDTIGVAPGFYTLTVSATTNTGYAAKEITRSLIVRESSYTIAPSNTTVTYNGRTQGLTVTLDGFDFKGTGINEAANKSWTVKYYDQQGNLVEPTQAGTYKAVVTLPASAYWTEQSIETTFTIKQRSVSIADAIAQAKVYDGTTDVSIVEVMLNDAVTDQTTTGLPTGDTGIINGDSIYAVATEAKLSSANAGDNSFTISTIELRGDDANNYVWDNDEYTENIYVSRSQVYGVSSTDVTLKAGEKLPADAVYMIDQAGNKITTYDVLYYLHTDTEIKKVDNTNEKGLYTVIVRPKQDNYKSGVTLRVTVGDATNYTAAVAPKPSTLITISNTAELYGAVQGVKVELSNKDATYTVTYLNGTAEVTDPATLNAGRYLVKVTASTGDMAYGIYTITKARPSIDFNAATDLTYNSKPQDGYTGTPTVPTSAESYITYAGDVAIGYNTPADGNVDEQAPVDAGTYTVTLHVNETANYTAHEISKSFTIAKKALTIEADSWQTTQYDAFPDMTASYTGLAAETGDTTPDTSLRDVQIAPEFLYNPKDGKSDYNNVVLDSVGYVAIQPIDALSKNYAISYVDGQYTKQRDGASPDLAIHGLPQSGDRTVNRVYFGDVIQLYPYGYYTTLGNGSGILEWSVVTTAAGFKGTVTIGKETGLLNVNGVGEFTVTLKRGVGEQQISTSVTVTAIPKEAKIALKNVDKVYTGASQTYDYTDNVTVHDELYQPIGNFVDSKLTRTNTDRTNVGTQVTTAQVTGAWAYQSETYGGLFTINDKEATVAPVADAHSYGEKRTIPNPAYTSTEAAAISNVLTASQTDAYNRLDVHDGYEILVAGTENMNYNVKYTTDETAEDSAVTTYGGETFTSKTTAELNDATVYGETPNVLDWTLVNAIGTTRGTGTDAKDYADNLADFDLPDTFVWQDKDDCTGNKVTYKSANRTTDVSDSNNIKYNQDKLEGSRTSEDPNTDENYTLKFNTVENSGAANYKLTNVKTGNNEAMTNALTANSKGFITPATGESNDVSGENFVEGSANIAQRPIKLEKAVADAQLYWRLPQSQLYTALVNVLKAEENSVGRGLAKGHTIEDLDLSFSIGGTPVDKNSDQPMTGLTVGTQTVTVTVGDTNYKLENGPFTFEVDFQTMRIRATYYNKTFTGFDVRIEKIDAAGNSVGPLDSTKGLTFKVLKQTNGVLDTETDYAANKSFTFVSKDGTYGYFHGSYSQLPLLGNGELYVFQMYEYGVPLERK